MKDIKLIKLANGFDLVAEVVKIDENRHSILLKKPLQLIPTQQGLTATPFALFSNDEEIDMNLNHILCITNPTDVMIDSYNQETSGISIANPGDIPPSTPQIYRE